MSFTDQEIEEFKVEARELLESAEKHLLALDKGADYRTSFDGIFRSFHNVKGGAGMMELAELAKHTHELENTLMGFKDAAAIPHNYINFFLRGVDAARSVLEGKAVQFDYTVENPKVEAQAEPSAPVNTTLSVAPPENPAAMELPDSAISEFLAECDEQVERMSSALQVIEMGTYDQDLVNGFYRDIHSLKGSAYLFSYNELGNIAHAMESSLELVRGGSHLPSADLINALFRGVKLIEFVLAKVRTKAPLEKVDVAIATLTKLLNQTAAKLPPVSSNATPAAPAEQPSEQKMPESVAEATPVPLDASATKIADQPKAESQVVPVMESSVSAPKESEASSTIRVPVTLLDSLMNLMGEMVLVRNQVLQFASKSDDREFLSMSKRLNVVTTEIQGEMMKTRMQPVGSVLSKFNRVVRDLSHDLGKQISLSTTGADTEVDKSLLEAVKDPLTHIVRNSCDHGIELPDVRRKMGKPPQGSIEIRAYHEGGQVVIEIKDDGKGLNPEMLVRKAIEKKIIAAGQEKKMTEKEIFGLIFAPGFSTAEKVTSVSGRGVGMDVVRTNIERIGGNVDLSSKVGEGTSIKIRIPLTLAIVPALIVQANGGTFAVPQAKLEELVRIDQDSSAQKIEMLQGAPVYRLRGRILPLVDLNGMLQGKGPGQALGKQTFNVAVLKADTGSLGLIIDEIKDTADIVVKPLNRLLKSLMIFSGATILGDGNIALILDVTGIAKAANMSRSLAQADLEAKSAGAAMADAQDYLLVKVSSATKHAIVLNYVHRLEEFKRNQVEHSGQTRVIRYGNTLLNLISVNQLLGYGPSAESENVSVVVIRRAGRLYGIEVEAILDTLSTQVEMDNSLPKVEGVFGHLNLPNELVVVIDPFELIERAFPSSQHVANASPMPAPAPLSLVPAPASEPERSRVLLVEDTVFFRKAIKTVLEKGGYEVVTANNGEEAIQILNQDSTIALIVSDIEMPRVNGFQLAKAIRQNAAWSGIPMLAISSRADPSYLKEGKAAGFDVYLEKLKPAVLLAELGQLASRGRRAA